NPNAIKQTETKQEHQCNRAAVADQLRRHAGDWQHRDGHPHVLKNMREDEGCDSHHQNQSQLITGKKRNKRTYHQKQREPAEEKYSPNKSPLLSNGGENVVVVHSRRGKKPKLDLRIWRLKSFAGPAT